MQLYITKFKNNCLVGTKISLSLLHRESSAFQLCNEHVLSLNNGHLDHSNAKHERNQKCPNMFKIYKTEKHFKNEQRSKDAAAKKRPNTSGVGKINNYYEGICIPHNNTD